MDINLLKEILAIQTYSYQSEQMEAYIINRCEELGYEYVIEDGSIYVRKGFADSYPCIVSHMDTVHRIVEDLTVLQIKDNLTGFNTVTMEQTGIGGDDKVGVYIAFECLKYFDNIKVVFFRDEEVGCDGSYNADMDFFSDCRFVLQCDRKGNNDFVTNASGTKMASKGFKKAIAGILSDYGYKIAGGFMTDVMALKEMGLNCSAANMSCGYHNPHSDNEYVNIPDVENCLAMVLRIAEDITDTFYHKNEAKKVSTYSYSAKDWSTRDYAVSTYETFDDKPAPSTYKECECCLSHTDNLRFLSAYNMWACDSCYEMEEDMNRGYSKTDMRDESFSEIEAKIDADIRLKNYAKKEKAIIKELYSSKKTAKKAVEVMEKWETGTDGMLF